jgi:fructosamine-3-kinase
MRCESVAVSSTQSPADWRARLSEVVGRLEKVRPLSGNAWSVMAAGRSLVAKVGPGAPDEADGLRRLGQVAGGPPVPEVVLADDELVVTTAVRPIGRTSAHDESFGHALATLHAAPQREWGGGSSWIGACRVNASARPDGAAFYGARLRELAARCGLEGPVERVVVRLPTLLPPDGPALVHGDLWWGNVLAGADGRAWLIDPSVHGGHPEEDLAMLALFGAVPDRLRHAYEEVRPLVPGWTERVALFQLYPLLVHAVLFDGSYHARAEAVARRYS